MDFLKILESFCQFLFIACIIILGLIWIFYITELTTETNKKVDAIYNSMGLAPDTIQIAAPEVKDTINIKFE